MPTGRQIFECIKSYPNEDPIHLLGFNANTEIQYNYNKSKSLLNAMIISEKRANEIESNYATLYGIQNKIFTQDYPHIREVIQLLLKIKDNSLLKKQERIFETITLCNSFLISLLNNSFSKRTHEITCKTNRFIKNQNF